MPISVKKANQLFTNGNLREAAELYQQLLLQYNDNGYPKSLIEHCIRQLQIIHRIDPKIPSASETHQKTIKEPTEQKRLCVYTDSRGFHKNKDFKGKMFWEKLEERFHIDSFIQPFKWTSLLDFIGLIGDGIIKVNSYDYIIVWASIVDFSPRPNTQLMNGLCSPSNETLIHIAPSKIYSYARKVNDKNRYIRYLTGNKSACASWHKDEGFDIFFQGEKTSNLYPLEVATIVGEHLERIKNLIFIDSCNILPDWDGDFPKGRPRNINAVVREYEKIVTSKLTHSILLSEWTPDQIRQYTTDNLHLTDQGSDAIHQKILTRLDTLSRTPTIEYTISRKKHNVIVTASDSNFFSSLLILIRSALEHSAYCIDHILVFNIGLTSSQIDILNSIRKVGVFSYSNTDRAALQQLHFDFFSPSTYGFKAYALARFHNALSTQPNDQINCLYIDAGIKINRDIFSIFKKISDEGIFCVDHDDCHDYYGTEEFMLLHILSPRLFQERNGVKFDLLPEDKLIKPYIKAGFFGYHLNGPYQSLIDEHYNLCTQTDVLVQPKTVTDKDEQMWYRNNTKVGALCKAKGINFGSLNYINGRQDQTSLSYVVVKADAPIQNSRLYNFTESTNTTKDRWLNSFKVRFFDQFSLFQRDIVSTLTSLSINTNGITPEELVDTYVKATWEQHEKSSRLTTAIKLPRSSDADSSLTSLHRGADARHDEWKYAGWLLNHKRNTNDRDIFILLGNGPSLADVDLQSLRKFSTFGLNAAYRAYERINFWPRYFGCFDSLVCSHHARNFEQLIRSSPIEKFFFINIDDKKSPIFKNPEILNNPKFQKIQFVARSPAEKERNDILACGFEPFIDMLTSGTNSLQCALLMGFRKIIILGCDANYVELVDGAKQETNKNKLVMEKTPEQNPNYWFSDYQQEGDRFNLPNLTGCQLPAWGRLARTINALGVNAEIINCSPISKIEDFKKMPLEDAIRYFQSY